MLIKKIFLSLFMLSIAFQCFAQEIEVKKDSLWDNISKKVSNITEREPFYFRAGVLHLAPDVKSSELILENVGGIAKLAINNGPIAGSAIDLGKITTPSIIAGYILPWFNNNLSLEVILATPLTIELKAAGTLKNESIAPYAVGNIPTGIPPLGEELGSIKALPPVITSVYRFNLWHLRPYLGVGFAYLFTYDHKITNSVLTAITTPELEVENPFGFVGQLGLDINFYKNWFFNIDVKYIDGLDLKAKVKGIYIAVPDLPLYSMTRVGDARVDVSVDPWIYQIGIGFRF